MRTEFLALAGVQRLLQKGAEDRRLDLAPVGLCRLVQFAYFLCTQMKDACLGKQIAVEAFDLLFDSIGKIALVHRLPQLLHHVGEVFRGLFAALKHGGKRAFGQQFYILGEHGEKAAHQKHRHLFRVRLFCLKRL